MGITFSELKRRNVIRVAIAYVITSWLLLQIADVVLNNIGAPRWVFQTILLLLAIGFFIAVIFSWVYEVTPQGLKKEQDVGRSGSITTATGRKLDFVIIGLMVVGLIYFAFDKFFVAPSRDDAPVSATPVTVEQSDNSIAVLPFINMSDDPANEYFSDGLSEELLNALVRTGGLRVTGRTSSFAFKDQKTDLREIGRILNVSHVLEGSVRKDQNRVRITAQLVKTADGFHVWSDTFDRELDDIFAIQQEIANRVTGSLHVALLGHAPTTSGAGAAGGRNGEAYEEYLRGKYLFQRNLADKAGMTRAREHFARALELDPEYVDGYWGMFQTWHNWHNVGHGPFEESAAQIAFYAAKLQQLAPGSEQAALANAISATVQWDFLRAYEILREAVERFQGSAAILAHAGYQSVFFGRFDQGIALLQKAIRLDPLSLEYVVPMATVQHHAGDCDGLQETRDRALELNETAVTVRYHLAMCIFETDGDAAAALTIASEEPVPFLRDTALAILKHRLGDPVAAQQQLNKLMTEDGDSSAYQYAQIYSQWGDAEKALVWLEKAFEIRDPGLTQMKTDALLKPLHDAPRFIQLLKSTGLDAVDQI